jgi:hypothetical protein
VHPGLIRRSGPGPDAFVGRWRIERELSDARTGRSGHFAGTLVVAAEAGGYGWDESGTLVWGEHTGPAQRRLCLRVLDGSWWMCFADGRRFHPWQVGPELVHPCAADTYRGAISQDPDRPGRFETVWDVTGPAKQQRIVSRMTRVE